MGAMGALAAFGVGLLLGWLATWILQKRIDDDLRDEVARLQRELADCQREHEKTKALVPASESDDEPVQDEDSTAVAPASPAATVVAARTAEVDTLVVDTSDAETPAAETLVVVEELPEEANAGEAETAGRKEAPTEIQETEDHAASEQRAAVVAAIAAEGTVTSVTDADTGVADLTVIKGIGPKFAETLNAAGITSYAALAQTPPERLQEIIQPAAWQKLDFEDWIAQASALSRQSRRLQIGDDLTRLEGIGPTYAQKLRGAGITSFAQLAESDEDSLAAIINAPSWQQVNYGAWIAQADLAAAGDEAGLKQLQDELYSRKGDNIGLIQGIGSSTQTALNDAGITTYAQLAEATPEQLNEILSAAGVRRGNTEAWIAEAKLRAQGKRVSHGGGRTRTVPTGASLSACPQDLGQIEGIGETYEQRLYESGIGTYWEVGMLPQDELTEILQIKAFQGVDLDAIQESARTLAQSTNSMGRVWDGTEPDDFETLQGIGEVFEQRLYDAGICTFAALAQLTVERLQEICQAPPNFTPNFTRWLEQAREASS